MSWVSPEKTTTTTSPRPPAPHAADKAGGSSDEVLFSSDGLEALPAPIPPPPPQQHDTKEYEYNNASLLEDEPLMSMNDAMRAFGRRFDIGPAAMSPEERLQRLEQELQSVGKDMAADDVLQLQVQQLRSRLEQQMQAMQHQAKRRTTEGTTTSDNSDHDHDGSVITDDLERVMRRLERAIGTMSSTGSTSINSATGATATTTTTTTTRNKGLLERVATLEHVVDQLDDRKLELAARHAKILRSDLQAASKARSKLLPLTATTGALSSGNSNPYHMDDAKTISMLYTTMTELQDVRQHLPALSQRLQALAMLHTDASTFSQRLAALEQNLQSLTTHVGGMQQAVTALQENWNGSVQASMQQNLQAIDERLAAVRNRKE